MKNVTIKLGSFTTVKLALAAVIIFSMIACDASGGGGGGGGHWLMSSQTTYAVTDGIVGNSSGFTNYSWIAYRYTNETNYEEEYTTSYNYYNYYSGSNAQSYSEYHYTRNGQTSNSTTETISKTSSNGAATVSSGTSSTTSSYDSASGLTSSSTTVSSGVTTGTIYSIELLSDSGGVKTYKYSAVSSSSNGYNIIKIQNGRTLETSYYDANSVLIYTTTYTQPDNAEIRSKLPNFTLYNTHYYSSSYNSSYQTAEVLPDKDYYPSDYLQIRVRTFNDGVLSSQTDYAYNKPFNNNEEGKPSNAPPGVIPGSWGDYEYYEENGKITISEYTKIGGNATIPAQINGKPVTGIGHLVYYGPGAFQNCYKLASVTIPNSVTSIGNSAFYNCWSLASVTIPNSVTSIGERAFSDCYSLASVTIPNSVTSIGSQVFYECPSLTSVTFQGTIPENGFDDNAFPGDLQEKYLAGGAGTYTTTNGYEWTKQGGNGGGQTLHIYAVAFGDGKFVVSVIGTSTDGVTWTAATDNHISFNAIAYGNGKFVAGGYSNTMSYSSDGLTWTALEKENVPFGRTADVKSIAYGSGKFVVGGTSGSNTVYSSDGITWTAVTGNILGTGSFGATAVTAIAYGNNRFVAGGINKTATSTDGVTWTAAADIDILGIDAIAYGNGTFVIGGGDGKMATSPDGITWTPVTNSPFTREVTAIAYGNGKFVAGSYTGKMATSHDGVTWTSLPDSTFGIYEYGIVNAIAYGNGKFVAVGYTDLDIYTGKVVCLSDN